jgi:hypothetical protein
MGMESMNPGAEPVSGEQEVSGEPSNARKIQELLAIFESRRAEYGLKDPLDDERVLEAARLMMETEMGEERAKYGWVGPASPRDDFRDAA